VSGRLFRRRFGAGWLLAGASPEKLLDLVVEFGDIAGLPAGDPISIYHSFGIHPIPAGIHQVATESCCAPERAAG
jgi:hypothetical protein